MASLTRSPFIALAAVALSACSGTSSPAETPLPQASSTPTPSVIASTSPSPVVAKRAPVVVRYRIERRTSDTATANFATTVRATLRDPRGWQRGDVRLVNDQRAPYVVLLAEPDEVQRRCRPYDVYRRYSCQNGPLVALNAERWRHATPEWTGSLAAYRQMLINHEFGHLLGLHHPRWHCSTSEELAPVMAQQSTELNGCRPNPWPLPGEIALLAKHTLPLAPPPDRH